MRNVLSDNLPSFVHGIVRTEDTPDGVLLHRMTPSQIARADREERFRPRARSAAGIRISFTTDSPRVDLRLVLPAVESNYLTHAGIDIEIDGYVRTMFFPAGHMQRVAIDCGILDTDTVKNRVISVYLPYHRPTVLQSLNLEPGHTAAPLAPRPRRLLMIGDSITQGAYAPSSYPTVAVQLAALLDMELLNHGLGGHVFDESILDSGLEYKPDLVTVAYGTNDWNQLSQDFERDRLRAFLPKLKTIVKPGNARLVIVSPLWRIDHAQRHPGGTLDEFVSVINEEVISAGGLMLVDGYELIPHVPEMFCPDGIHPNATGMAQYAINLYRAIQRAQNK